MSYMVALKVTPAKATFACLQWAEWE